MENTIYELLLGESKLEDCIIPLNFDNLSLIPSNVNLAGAEIELIGVEDKEFILKTQLIRFAISTTSLLLTVRHP